MEWFYAKHGKQEGPIELATLRAKYRSGEIAATDLVWKEGMPEWVAANTVPELTAEEQGGASSEAPSTTGGESQQQVTGGQVLSQPASGAAVGMVPPTPGLAIASLVCGILSVVFACCYGLCLLPGIAAVICGHMQMKKYKESTDVEVGKGLVIAGLITGYIGILICLLYTSPSPRDS